jgi:hypothetical protein
MRLAVRVLVLSGLARSSFIPACNAAACSSTEVKAEIATI